MRNTLVAAVRLIPTPAAFSDNNMTVGESADLSLNVCMESSLLFIDMLPSNRVKVKPDSCKGFSRMSRKEEN